MSKQPLAFAEDAMRLDEPVVIRECLAVLLDHFFCRACRTAFSRALSKTSERLIPNTLASDTKSVRADMLAGFRSAAPRAMSTSLKVLRA